jgi:RNA polymerase sigma factor (sigma-70 family)
MDPREQLWAEAMRAERQGDAAAYQRLLKEIADLLRRLIRSRLAQLGLSTHEAEDLVQEVLISLHTRRHTWDADRPFLPWLHAITRYKFIDAARRLKRETRYRIDLTSTRCQSVSKHPRRMSIALRWILIGICPTSREVRKLWFVRLP